MNFFSKLMDFFEKVSGQWSTVLVNVQRSTVHLWVMRDQMVDHPLDQPASRPRLSTCLVGRPTTPSRVSAVCLSQRNRPASGFLGCSRTKARPMIVSQQPIGFNSFFGPLFIDFLVPLFVFSDYFTRLPQPALFFSKEKWKRKTTLS